MKKGCKIYTIATTPWQGWYPQVPLSPSRMPIAKRWYRETASSVFLKALKIGFILGHPGGNFLRRKLTGRRKLRPVAAQARGKKQDEFLLLLPRQQVGNGLNFRESAHSSGVLPSPEGGSRHFPLISRWHLEVSRETGDGRDKEKRRLICLIRFFLFSDERKGTKEQDAKSFPSSRAQARDDRLA